MKNLKTLLTKQLNLQRIPKWIPIVFIMLASVGFADSTYLAIQHFQNEIPPCTVGGCESVLTSQYAQVFGIPMSLLGAIYYLVMLVLLFLFVDTKKEILLRLHGILSVVGFLASVGLMYIMIFIIKAFCPYCAVSAIVSITTFCFVLWTRYLSREAQV
jgi:uncharacterized membrane protein